MRVEGDKVFMEGLRDIQVLSVLTTLELNKKYAVYSGEELWGWFTRRPPVVEEGKQIIFKGDYQPVKPLESITLKVSINKEE